MYDYKYMPMDANNALECIKAYNKWYENKNGSEALAYEKEAIGDIMTNFDRLECSGGVFMPTVKFVHLPLANSLIKTPLLSILKRQIQMRSYVAPIRCTLSTDGAT